MSGHMPPALQATTTAIALRAEADARGISIPRLIAQRTREALKARERDSLPGQTWRAIDIRTRKVLVMLAATAPGDANDLARQPWESFTDNDRASMASCARELSRELKGAACLW